MAPAAQCESTRPGDVVVSLNLLEQELSELEVGVDNLEAKTKCITLDNEVAKLDTNGVQPEPSRSDFGTAIYRLGQRLRLLNIRTQRLHRTIQL